VTAQDIGALPDRSIAEAMQRIPGITLSRTDSNRDPARLTVTVAISSSAVAVVSSQVNGHEVFRPLTAAPSHGKIFRRIC